MTCTVCWEAIAGIQVNSHLSADAAVNDAEQLIKRYGHGNVYVHDAMTAKWYHYTKGIRGRINECEIPADEVPKPFQLIVMLES